MANKRRPLILDLHIPYCIRPENFFGRYYLCGSNEEKNRYLACLGREILSYEGDLDEYEIQAVRLSGGSASVMNPDLLGKTLALVREKLPVAPGGEFSYDALPNTIGTPSLTGISSGHPNRVELMVRSDNDAELRILNCPFRAQDTHNAMLFLHRFHLNNIGMTVNYGIPGQTMQSWHNTLHACEIMWPGHITVEPLGAAGWEDAQEKQLVFTAPQGLPAEKPAFPDEAVRFEMYSHAVDYLKACGYVSYGAGLFCLPEHVYRYRTLYADGVSVLGMGVGNVSRFEGYYIRNTNNNILYMKHAGDYEKATAQVLEMEQEDISGEYIYGRLGMSEGFSLKLYEEKLGDALPPSFLDRLDGLVRKGWAVYKEEAFVLTKSGEFHYREIMKELLQKKGFSPKKPLDTGNSNVYNK